MKKQNQILAITFLSFFVLMFSCKKDESEEMIDILTSKTWKYGLEDINTLTNPSGSNNVYFAAPKCEQDDTFTFKTDGTVLRSYGNTKCDGNTATSKTVNYSFNKTTKELVIDGVKYTVTEENKTQFKFYAVVPNASGFNNVIYLLQ